jgi:hypothetical protein
MGLRHLLCMLALLAPLVSRAQAPDVSRPLRITLGAGAEGHTGNLGEAYEIGPVAAAAVALRALPWLDVELGYSVGLHQIDTGRDGGLVDGYDVVRQGPQLSLSLGPALQGVRPYLLTGVGVSWLNVRGLDDPDFRDDTDVYLPLGGGLAVTAGRITLDARLSYHALFGQQSVDAPDGDGAGTGGRYQALVSLGLSL